MQLSDVLKQLQRVEHRFPKTIDLDRFENMVVSGDVQVFIAGPNSVMVGQVYDNTDVLILAAAGDLNDLLNFEPKFCQWYRARGCKTVSLAGRRGWQKHLVKLGYDVVPGKEFSMTKSLELH